MGGRGSGGKRNQSYSTVDSWYDRSTKSWVIQKKDREGNQVGSAEYVGTRSEKDVIVQEWQKGVDPNLHPDVGKQVDIRSRSSWANGEWGIIQRVEGDTYYVGIAGDTKHALVFNKSELRFKKGA